MTAHPAARFDDPIAHTSYAAMLAKAAAGIVVAAAVGALIAAAVAAAPVLLAGGGVAAAASAGAAAATATIVGGAGALTAVSGLVAMVGTMVVMNSNPIKDLNAWIDEKLDAQFPPQVTGRILTGSSNVQINTRPDKKLWAARAASNLLQTPPERPPVSAARQWLGGGLGALVGGMLLGPLGALAGAAIGAALATPDPGFPGVATDDDQACCDRDGPPQWLAEGSSNVLINGQPAHRKGDKTTCEAKTSKGSANVKIGGETLQVREISSETPLLIRVLPLLVNALQFCRGGWSKPLSKLACIGLNVAIGTVVGDVMNGGYQKLKTAIGFPVHAPSGAKILRGEEDLDFVLPSLLPLVWQRNYSSLDTREGLFGRGFSVPVEVALRLHRGGEHPHALVDWQGREIPFPHILPGESHWNAAEGYRLACLANGQYVVEDVDGLCHDFGPATARGAQTLQLQRIEDRNGNWIALRRDHTGKLMEVADRAQRLYRLDYHPQYLTRVAAVVLLQSDASLAEHRNLPRTLVSYDYDAHGRLSSVINALNHTSRRFTWHDTGPGAGLMASHTLPDGLICHYRWAAFADHPRVVEHWTDMGERWSLDYSMPSAPGDTPGQTTATDHLGRVERWDWDTRYAPCSHTNANGERTYLHWDEYGQLVKAIQPDEGAWLFEYDDHGNLISETDPLGQTLTRQWRQDRPLLASETQHGRTWRYCYDHLGNLYRITDPANNETLLGYDDHGQVITRTDPRGGVSHHSWNIAGQLIAHTDCSSRSTQYDYGAYGELARIRDAAGQTDTMQADVLGHITAHTATDSGIRRYHWQASGRLQQQTDPLGATTCYTWDRQGRLAGVTDALKQTTGYRYAAAGNLVALTNPNGESYRFGYDAADRLIEQTGVDGLVQRTTLDAMGRPVVVRQAVGTADEIRIDLQRDALGRLTAKATPETVTLYQYESGQLTRISRRLRLDDDTAGPQLDQIDLTYDVLGQLITETATWHPTLLEQAGISARDDQVHTLRHQYDVLGNRIATTLPDGETLNALYYGSGHLHQLNLESPAGIQTLADFERDVLHREIRRSQGQIAAATSYAPGGQIGHVRAGNLDLPGSAAQLERNWDYNLNGECSGRRSRDTGNLSYRYDALGRITGTSQLPLYVRGELQAPRIELPAERFDWDAAGNPNPGHATHGNRLTDHNGAHLQYDGHGRLIGKIRTARFDQEEQQQTLNWNKEHQLVQVYTVRGTHRSRGRYAYDALGRRIASNEDSEATLALWQGLQLIQHRQLDIARLDSQTGQQIVTQVYLPGSYTPVARIETFSGARGNAIYEQHQQITGSPLQPIVYHYHTAPNGTPEALSNDAGNIVWQGHYNTWGELVSEEIDAAETRNRILAGLPPPMPQNLRMPGQWHDRVTRLHYNTFRYYDSDMGRFISPDPIGLAGGINLYRYAPNPVGWIDPWGWACSSTSGDNPKARVGRQKHKEYKRAEELANPTTFIKEYRLPSGRRIDALDLKNGIVYELKPNNSRAISRGKTQVKKYIAELRVIKEFEEIDWKSEIDVYD